MKQEHAQEPLPSTEAAAQAPFGSPQPPVCSLADDIAEQMQPQRQAASASGQPATGTNAAPSQQAAPGQPGSKAEAGTPAGSQAGPSGAVPGARRAAGTTADPVIISDSDSEDEAPQVTQLSTQAPSCTTLRLLWAWLQNFTTCQCHRVLLIHEGLLSLLDAQDAQFQCRGALESGSSLPLPICRGYLVTEWTAVQGGANPGASSSSDLGACAQHLAWDLQWPM